MSAGFFIKKIGGRGQQTGEGCFARCAAIRDDQLPRARNQRQVGKQGARAQPGCDHEVVTQETACGTLDCHAIVGRFKTFDLAGPVAITARGLQIAEGGEIAQHMALSLKLHNPFDSGAKARDARGARRAVLADMDGQALCVEHLRERVERDHFGL
eukprot:TRINITY_DN11098_c0_g3_i1.p2 TRINITY_DN11098_c0_g3~~TRINITY_DN11098_c0_g3_i1.p2  ORF type:complete len:156 (+),score=13.08 TRINITY_DN11098_c0_g3_i1:486-953(+)